VKTLTLEPAGGGCFEVTVDGEEIWSKLRRGKFPEPRDMLEQVQERLDSTK